MSVQADTESKEIVRRQITEKENGIKEIVTYSIDLKTQKKHKTVQEVKPLVFVRRTSPTIEARHANWKKYGKNALETTLEKSCLLDDVNFLIGKEYTDSMKLEEANKKAVSKGPVKKCATCGGDHMNFNCPYRKQIKNQEKLQQQQLKANSETKHIAKDGSEIPTYELYSTKKTFLTPKLKERMDKNKELIESGKEPLSTLEFEKLEEDKKTLFISNLSETVTEEDIRRELFPLNGFDRNKIERINLSRDKKTGKFRGMAYVVVTDKDVADACVQKMNGVGFMYTIINVETLATKFRGIR